MDQVRPGEIDVEEIALGPILSRQQPSRLDPCLQHLCVEWRMRDKLVGLHPHTPMAPLGASTLAGRHCAMSFSSSGSGVSGSITFRVTCSSPRPPSGRNTPFPFRRNTRPVLVHFGTVIVTAPDVVGTVTLPPSTASFSEIGSSSRYRRPCG